MTMKPSAIEADDSWATHLQRSSPSQANDEITNAPGQNPKTRRRRLTTDYTSEADFKVDLVAMEQEKAAAYLEEKQEEQRKTIKKAKHKHKKKVKELYKNPGIRQETVHGMMIDAGSTGSRLHLYEWEPRILTTHKEVETAVAGMRLSYPESTSRWTDRLRPGIATFANLPDDELEASLAEYLSPLLDFANTILREKQDQADTFPIFFRATGGMRTLDKADRTRLLGAVRSLFNNKTFCQFRFEDEYARILSGEEEAIFGWTGINFVLGNLVEETEGIGTVVNPKLTYGALDMGGASTQISFYEPNEDIMSNLFKLQIGQAKHWNLYAHSFLYYGINEARNRFHANLLAGKDASARLVAGVDNPCLPGGSSQEVHLNIHIDDDGNEVWRDPHGDFYHALLQNKNKTANFDECMAQTKRLLHLENSKWCEFAHKGECSFNNVAMADLPRQSEHFGEFLAFSNYYHVWDFLGMNERSSLQELYDKTQVICSLSKKELFAYNEKHAQVEDEEVEDYCFRSSYIFNMLRNGYGFEMNEYITATNILNGHKVGWPLGAMMYEINTFPWEYIGHDYVPVPEPKQSKQTIENLFIASMFVGILVAVTSILCLKRQRNRHLYQPLKDVVHVDV